MIISNLVRLLAGTMLLVCIDVVPAAAQATRTWVSGVGDDVNPCSRTAPCKTFAGAISKTAAGGTISVLDPGGYGAVTITKSIAIQTDPAFGSITNSSVTGIIVNAAATDDVYIRGLIIDSAGNGANGVRFLAGRSLTITDCVIRGNGGAPGVAVSIAPSAGTSAIVITDSTIVDNTIGLQVAPTGNALAKVMLKNVLIDRSTGAGIVADGVKAKVFMGTSVITNNAPGLSPLNGASIISYGNNVIANNTPNGAPTAINKLK